MESNNKNALIVLLSEANSLVEQKHFREALIIYNRVLEEYNESKCASYGIFICDRELDGKMKSELEAIYTEYCKSKGDKR